MTENRSLTRTLLLYVGTGLVSFVAFALAFRLWHADLNVPFSYAWYGDAVEPRTKALLEGAWFWNPNLAAPFGQDAVAITQLNMLKWGMQWFIVELTRNPFLTQNLFEMIDPVLSSVTFLYAVTRLGLSYAAAIPCAILFGNLFTLYWRIMAAHAIPAAYWMTPLGCLAVLQIARGMRLTKSREAAVFLGTAVLIGLESHYEVFFTGFLGVAAALIGCIQQRSFQAFQTARAFLVIMAASFAVNASPTVLWSLTHHRQVFTYERNPVEAYLYSVSISQLILPNQFHRIALLQRVRQHFDSIFPALSNENAAAALGIVGTLGLCVLVIMLIARSRRKISRTVEHAALLVIAAIALATPGGLGTIFNRFVSPDIRAYNRISPWIAFFCLFAVAYVLNMVWHRLRDRNLTALYVAVAAFVAIGGVLDQSPDHSAPFALSKQRVTEDRAWTQQMEASVPPGAAILQLPYAGNYESLISEREYVPYLFSQRLRWSVGAVDGTAGATFEQQIGALPPAQLVPAAVRAGFDGILVYRSDIAGNEAAFEKQLATLTHHAPAVSPGAGEALFPIYQLRKASKT